MIKVLTFYVIFIQCKEEEKIATNLSVYFPTIFFLHVVNLIQTILPMVSV